MSELGAILERGRVGLESLGRYLPLAQQLVPPSADHRLLAERFAAEQGIALESIRQCRTHVLSARDALTESLRVQADIAESLDGVLDTGARSGTRLLERMEALAVALTDVIDAIPEAVATKAARIAALDGDIDGREFDEIEAVVEAARRLDPDALSWTEYVFLPAVDSRVERFLTACDDCHAEIEECMVRLTAALTEKRPDEAVILPQAGPR